MKKELLLASTGLTGFAITSGLIGVFREDPHMGAAGVILAIGAVGIFVIGLVSKDGN